MSSLEPIAYRVSCCAWDCDPDRFRPTTTPITLRGNRTSVTRQLKALGWAPAPGRGHWWCPTHAALGARPHAGQLNG